MAEYESLEIKTEINSAGASKMTVKENLLFESLPPIIKGGQKWTSEQYMGVYYKGNRRMKVNNSERRNLFHAFLLLQLVSFNQFLWEDRPHPNKLHNSLV